MIIDQLNDDNCQFKVFFVSTPDRHHPKNVEAIVTMPKPRIASELKSYLVRANSMQCFLHNAICHYYSSH
jgi:hypothetical protein